MANENNRPPIPRVHWFDGINPQNTDFQVEQDGELQHVAYVVNDFHGSGVLQKTPVMLPPILNTAIPNPDNISFSVLSAGNFDGQGIFVDRQPVDSQYGDQLLVTIDNVKIPLYSQTKIIIFGKVYNPNAPQGTPVLETLVFDKPGQKATFNYFTSVIAVFFNNFSGGTGRTALSASAQNSLNVSLPGKVGVVTIQEVGPLQVLDHGLVLHQSDAPNLDVRDFVTSTTARTFNDELTYVVNTAQNTNYVPVALTDLNQLPLNTTGLATKPFLDGTTNGFLYGQKVYLTTNNIQQLSFALSLADDGYGGALGWSGEFVVGIRPLQTTSIDQFANAIDLDPDVNVLFEASFTQNDFLNLGYVLSTVPQEVKLNFIGTAMAQPNGIITPNQYYVVTVSRRADTSIGKIYIEVGPKELQGALFTSFNPNTKAWTDDTQTDLWFKTYSAAVRVSPGIAYTNSGKMITLQKTATASDGSVVSAVAGPYPLAVIDSVASDNIIILESTENFTDPGEHPRTGNLVFLKIIDQATVSVLTAQQFNDLVAATNDANQASLPVVLGVVNDFNNRTNTSFTGVISLPGQVRKDQIVVFNTNLSDDVLEVNNVITPNNATTGVKYRIVESESVTQYLGDFNNDKIFTTGDLIKQLQVQDIFSAQSTNTATGTSFDPYSIFDTRSRDALGFGAETIEDFILADIDGYLTINSTDVARLQYLTTTLPAFVSPSPTSITIQTLTLENITPRNNPILVAQITNLDGYAAATFPDQLAFTALNVGDMRALSVGDKVTLSADGYTNVDGTFTDPAYSGLLVKKFVQRNDLLVETRFQSTVIPTVDQSYVLSFYNQNPVFNNKLGVFGEVATEVLEFVVPGIDLISAGIVPGDIVVISSDQLGQSRAGTYTISEVLDLVTFRISAPVNPIAAGIASAGIEIFASDGITPKLQDTAVVEFMLNTISLNANSITIGDRMHITSGPADLNGVYTVSRVISDTVLTIDPPLTALSAYATTKLTNTLTPSATTMSVASTTGFPSSGTLLIGTEQITYSGTTSLSFTGLGRGVNGTTAATHNINDVVSNTFAATFQFKDSTDTSTKLAPTALTGIVLGNGPLFPDIETLAPASLPNGVDSVFEFSVTHIPVTGTVNVHWVTGGVPMTMVFDAAPVQITGDGNPANSSINRLTGTIVIDTFLPPDAGTAITTDYRIAPIVTLKDCIPTVVNAVSPTQTDIEFKAPFINSNPAIDITGIRLCPYVIVQTNNADPPAIVLDSSGNVVAGAVTPNTINSAADGYVVPSRNVVLQLTDSAGNIPNITSGNYWMQVYSGTRVNLPAVQKEFLSDTLSLSSLINWSISKNNFEWLASNMHIRDHRRFLPTAFTAKANDAGYGTVNEMWVPADLYVGRGEILTAPGVPYHGDIEVTKINLDLPVTALLSNSIDIYNNLIASWSPTPGVTRGGRPAMMFSDGTYVGQDDFGNNTALAKNQVRVMPALGSLYLDGYQVPNAPVYTDLDEVLTKLHYEIRMGMYYDDAYGVLYFHAENIKSIFENEPILQTGVVRVVIDVALKKSGFNNPVVNVNATDILRLFTNPVDIVPTPKYSITGEIVAGFTVGKSTNSDG